MDDPRFLQFVDLLLAANQTMNLTRITDRDEAQRRHVDDSLTLLPYLPAGPIKIADVGSGGGVPGIILAIARPEARVTLIESTTKKAKFLEETVAALGLDNVRVKPVRAEEMGLGPLRQGFDVVTARAVGRMVWIAEWCLPLVRIGGTMLAMKGPQVHEELVEAERAIGWLGGGEPQIIATPSPGAEGHVIVLIPKIARTDKRLPRPADRAKGKPLTRL